MNKLQEINLPSVAKRVLLLIVPVLFMPFGIATYYACGLGSDPFSVFVEGEHALTGLSYGQITTVNNMVLLGLMLAFGRKYINIGTVITTFTTGPLIDLFRETILNTFALNTAPIYTKGLFLLCGCIVFSFGVGAYISVSLGIGPIEFISLYLVDKFQCKLKYVRIALDALFVVAGYFMGGIVGVGTLLGILATGPIVELTIKILSKPFNSFAGPIKKVQLAEAMQ